MSLIFPDKTVDFVLKALRKCPGSFLKLISMFQEVLDKGRDKGGGGVSRRSADGNKRKTFIKHSPESARQLFTLQITVLETNNLLPIVIIK